MKLSIAISSAMIAVTLLLSSCQGAAPITPRGIMNDPYKSATTGDRVRGHRHK
ncbi:MAG: hypothetical protein JWL86_5839 [Rhizobium sp.]|nr:hypothetical protein [Rhizobium sp.]